MNPTHAVGIQLPVGIDLNNFWKRSPYFLLIDNQKMRMLEFKL